VLSGVGDLGSKFLSFIVGASFFGGLRGVIKIFFRWRDCVYEHYDRVRFNGDEWFFFLFIWVELELYGICDIAPFLIIPYGRESRVSGMVWTILASFL